PALELHDGVVVLRLGMCPGDGEGGVAVRRQDPGVQVFKAQRGPVAPRGRAAGGRRPPEQGDHGHLAPPVLEVNGPSQPRTPRRRVTKGLTIPWPTPETVRVRRRQRTDRRCARPHRVLTISAAENWPTPRSLEEGSWGRHTGNPTRRRPR